MSLIKKEIYQKYIKIAKFEIKKKSAEQKSHAICLICEKHLQNVALRTLKSHRNVCKLECNDLKALELFDKENNELPKAIKTYEATGLNRSENCIKCGSRINNFREVDQSLGMYFAGCNIPLTSVESRHFHEFINLLNPIYKLPTRKTLSGSILDKIHQNINKKKVDNNITDGVLVIDGWKNSSSNSKNVVCILHKANEESIFLESWDFTTMSETGKALSDVFEEYKINVDLPNNFQFLNLLIASLPKV